ncbi:hypothetical protein OIE62_25640 [Streptomyces scopuliridis]|uniref:Uncharacterized protein n=1 Tax=Streptomyces scopuliridis TaxID=452529 RepID=A0ACD4ZJ91_9ACTN|nr:hypothetical protein [Streptomyces scopuliridis]WSB33972.1 hypothetical protein OG949_14575 [Streptomyces scopuliridis]WSB98254.1 hypothetical protein OG835_15300 [Streptomyces scopuliridis]WSC08044.1 hypothetical protein OIE62_25640 [Streptomyces scopuliridis]
MLRHEFRPGRLVAGLAVLGAAVTYAGDAAGAWHTPWYMSFVVVWDGLCLAALAAWTHYRIRRRRPARTASSENTGAPASTSGSQAMR